MSLRNSQFWIPFVVILMPAMFLFALPAALFIHPDTEPWRMCVIFAGQAVLTLGVPFIIARRIALRRR
jgi:hypothetical protein